MTSSIGVRWRAFTSRFYRVPCVLSCLATTKEIGQFGESHATLYLRQKGYRIRGRNSKMFGHELDIVAEIGREFVFCEVKTRSSDAEKVKKYGRPADAIDKAQRNHIRHAAAAYLAENGRKKHMHARFDVIEVYITPTQNGYVVERICHIEDAFRH